MSQSAWLKASLSCFSCLKKLSDHFGQLWSFAKISSLQLSWAADVSKTAAVPFANWVYGVLASSGAGLLGWTCQAYTPEDVVRCWLTLYWEKPGRGVNTGATLLHQCWPSFKIPSLAQLSGTLTIIHLFKHLKMCLFVRKIETVKRVT